jgi:hypothetical protein
VCGHWVPCFWAHSETEHHGDRNEWRRRQFVHFSVDKGERIIGRKGPGTINLPRTCPQ